MGSPLPPPGARRGIRLLVPSPAPVSPRFRSGPRPDGLCSSRRRGGAAPFSPPLSGATGGSRASPRRLSPVSSLDAEERLQADGINRDMGTNGLGRIGEEVKQLAQIARDNSLKPQDYEVRSWEIVKEVTWIPQMNLLDPRSWDKSLRYWDKRQPNPAQVQQLPDRCYSLMIVGTADRHIVIFNLQNPQGGMFPVSNMGGPFGIKQFCAIINHPQLAVLGIGSGATGAEFLKASRTCNTVAVNSIGQKVFL